jgi:thioredoxin-like negative regulator of GroEL
MQENYTEKYLKYKKKYLSLKLQALNMQGGGNEKTMILFKADWCGHCNEFKKTWEELQTQLNGKVKFVTYDSEADTKVMNKYKVSGFPTLMLQKDDQMIKYKGMRNIDSLVKFINKN